jgi:Domain of unknown function (DUF5659)
MTTDTYSTQDFYLSGFLMALDHPVIDYERQGNITYFQFEKTRELLSLVQDYFANNAVVNPVRYGNSIKNLKSLIHSNNNNNSNDTHNNLGATR